jgi:hypothetical protein
MKPACSLCRGNCGGKDTNARSARKLRMGWLEMTTRSQRRAFDQWILRRGPE